MVKFKSVAWPLPSPGKDFQGEERLTVPDQAMSLQQILDRFVRNEPVAVGKDVQFDEDPDLGNPLNVDLEKLLKMDRVDRDEYFEQVNTLTRQYKKEQDAREKKRKKDALDAYVKEQAEKLAAAQKPSA